MAQKARRVIVSITHIALILGILATPVVRADTPPPGVDIPPGRSAMLQPAAIPTTQVTMDEEGYTLWTTDWGDESWCVPVSTLRYPFDLGTQDPTKLSDASLILEFSEGLYHHDVQDPSWTVALNGNPPEDWQSVGAISGPFGGEEVVWNTAVIGFDVLRLIDGENNIWLQQHDTCPQEPGCTTCACTCINLKRYTLRAGVDLVISKVSPEPDIRNVWPDQREDSEIRVKFTTLVSPTTVNEHTFQVYYRDDKQQPVNISGQVHKLSDVEYAFVPDAPLRDGVRYQARVWGAMDAAVENYAHWVQDLSGGPLENGRHWAFWTLPQLEVRLEPVQVLEDEKLIVGKPTALRVYLSSANLHTNVWYKDLWEYVDVEDIQFTWGSPSGSYAGAVSWRAGGTDWHFAYAPETARRYRLNDKSARIASQDSVNYYGFIPEEAGLYAIRAAVTVLDSRGEPQRFVDLVTQEAIQTRWLNIHLRALAVGSDYGKTGVDDLRWAVPGHRRGVQALYPVPNVWVSHSAQAVPFYSHALVTDDSAPAGDLMLRLMLLEVSSLCVLSSNCDFMVGYAPVSWLADNGLTLPSIAPYSALVQNQYGDIYRFLVAHEGGHLYGFEHDTYMGGEGYDVQRRQDRRFSTTLMPPANNIYSFMNVDPYIESPDKLLWIEWRNYRALMTQLTTSSRALQQAATSDPLLLATGLITPTSGDVTLNPWYQLEPGEWQEPTPGPYQLMFLNSAGAEIMGYTRSFTASGALQPASGPERQAGDDEPSPFLLKVPYPATTARIQIRRSTDQALLAERVLSANPPSVHIVPPANDIWTGPQSITWQTGAIGTHHSAVLLSLDNGATWQAQAIHLTGATFTIETSGLPNSTQALVRVLATDGLNTAGDTAGPFTIDNPVGVDYVSPMSGTIDVNVDQPLYAGFRADMDPTTIHSATFTLSGGPYGTVRGLIRYDGESREATFIPQTRLAYSTTYTAYVSAAIHTLDGTPLADGATWSFTTEPDFNPPRPRLLSPQHGAFDVPLHTIVAVAWDRPLEIGAITTATFQMAKMRTAVSGGSVISGSVAYDAAAQMATFTPDTLLAPYTTYVVTLTAGISDTLGNATFDPTVWAFTTGDATPAHAFTKSYADGGHDTDGDGLYDYLVIQVGVQVAATGDYRLKGVLNDSAGAEIAWASHTATLRPGVSFMPLAFAGASIGGRGVDGPYILTGLTLSRVGTGGASVPLDQAMEVYRTFAYPIARFPAPLRFTGLPDVLLRPEEVRLNPAFNARDYAHHALLDSAQLTYTLQANSDLRAGVTLDSNGNLWVNPTSDWMGYSDVTLQATDGVLKVQDTFRVTVGWAYSLYLPLILRNFTAAQAVRSNWVVALHDDFEADGLWRYGSSISIPPGGRYYGGRRDCKAYSGHYSMWPFGDGEDGALLPCDSAYPNTLVSNMVSGISFDLEHTTQAELRMKVWTDLAPGDEICAMAALDAPVPDDDPRWLTYYGVCRSGTSNGWEDLALDLSNVPVIGNLIGQEKIWIAVRFQANATESRPGGAYVDDVVLRICPEGLTCDPALGYINLDKPSTASVGNYDGSVSEAALAVEDNGRVHVAWTGALNPHFDGFAFYATSTDGVAWTPYQILNYWQDYDPQLAVDNTRHQAHLIYRSNYDGILHHTVADGVVSDYNMLDRDAVTSPKIAVNSTTGYAYAVWHKGYYYPIGNDIISWRRRLWYASWDGASWSAPQRHVNDGDTGYGAIAAAPDGGTMLAWFHQWAQSSGGPTDPGAPIVPRTAYGTAPNDFPLRQAVSAPYELPEKDNSILLTYSPGDQKYYLASTHLMWPGHSRVYRYVWENGAWAGPLDVAGNTAEWATVWYIGAASDQPLVTYVYRTDAGFYVRTETNGVLSAAQSLTADLAARGYTGTPVAFFVDHAGGLHMLVSGDKNGVTGFYYVHP
ncbi:MAG TPA: Ig-like domain-containing protein [Anaerolineae bacterium]|nr:Ig-like domain-containing protein [Anaerolineae bacterium]